MPGIDDPPPGTDQADPLQRPVAFVLSGGCNRGAVQVGMLRALLEHGVRPDLILGCSVGALNGAALAENPTRGGIERLERTWRNLDGRDLMPRYRLPHAVALARRGDAIHPSDGLRQLLGRALCVRTFEHLEVPFECVATDVEQVSERWFGSGPLLEAVMASAAMPALFPPVEIAGRLYLDGGVVNDVPIQRAVERGARALFVLEAGSLSRSWSEPRRPFDSAMQAHWIARQHRYKKDLELLPAEVDVHLMPHGTPRHLERLRLHDFTCSGELIGLAYKASEEYLRQVLPAGVGDPRSDTAEWADV